MEPVPLPQPWFFVTPQSLLHPFFFLRNAPISQIGKLRLRDAAKVSQPGNSRAGTDAQIPSPDKGLLY